MRAIAVAAMLAAAASPAMGLDPGRMQCRYQDGSSQVLAIDGAEARAGAVVYRIGEERFITTRDCIFNLGPIRREPAWEDAIGRVSMTCDQPDGLPFYVAIASHAAIKSGVWLWREEATGDRYIATAPCIAEPGW